MRRTDASGFLDILMDAAPMPILAGYSEPILSHFANLLSPNQRTSSLSSRSVPSLLKVRSDHHPWLTWLTSLLKSDFVVCHRVHVGKLTWPQTAWAPKPSYNFR